MFLRAKRKGFLKKKENELREKLAERNELSRRLTPDEDVIRIWKEANENATFVPGVHFGVGIEFNDKVKGNLVNTAQKILHKKLELSPPTNKDVGEKDGFSINFPITID
jgi:hypothetical protein